MADEHLDGTNRYDERASWKRTVSHAPEEQHRCQEERLPEIHSQWWARLEALCAPSPGHPLWQGAHCRPLPGIVLQGDEPEYPREFVEILSDQHLRVTLGLHDGDMVAFTLLPDG